MPAPQRAHSQPFKGKDQNTEWGYTRSRTCQIQLLFWRSWNSSSPDPASYCTCKSSAGHLRGAQQTSFRRNPSPVGCRQILHGRKKESLCKHCFPNLISVVPHFSHKRLYLRRAGTSNFAEGIVGDERGVVKINICAGRHLGIVCVIFAGKAGGNGSIAARLRRGKRCTYGHAHRCFGLTDGHR